jgi:hypothetical protein
MLYDLSISASAFAATTLTVIVASDKARTTLDGVASYEIVKSALPEFARRMNDRGLTVEGCFNTFVAGVTV